MKQFIAPQILRVNGEQSPCECNEGTVCSYCVQANLILWEQQERAAADAKEGVKIIALNTLKKLSRRRISETLGVSRQTISNWLKSRRIPEKYEEKILAIV